MFYLLSSSPSSLLWFLDWERKRVTYMFHCNSRSGWGELISRSEASLSSSTITQEHKESGETRWEDAFRKNRSFSCSHVIFSFLIVAVDDVCDAQRLHVHGADVAPSASPTLTALTQVRCAPWTTHWLANMALAHGRIPQVLETINQSRSRKGRILDSDWLSRVRNQLVNSRYTRTWLLTVNVNINAETSSAH